MSGAGAFLAAHGADYTVMTGSRVEGHFEATAEHHTPWGVVHGGVYCTAIESAASIGASLAVRDRGQFAVGPGRVRLQNADLPTD